MWCKWQKKTSDAGICCTAHMHESRVFPCPYRYDDINQEKGKPVGPDGHACEDYEEVDTSAIPKGDYCYSYDENGNQVNCPYWSMREDKPRQENGHCSFIEKGDWEINADLEEYDPKTGEVRDLQFPVSLLWDQVKECGVNRWSDEEWQKMIDKGEVEVQKSEKPVDIPERGKCIEIRRKSKKDEKQP